VRDLLDAAQVARRCGVTRGWVYAHARELGVLRMGVGPRPRLRFDPDVVDVALRTGFTDEQRKQSRRRARRRNKSVRQGVELLPVGPIGGVASSRVVRSG
jgi:hypothetical protein